MSGDGGRNSRPSGGADDDAPRADVVRAIDLALGGHWDEAHDIVQRHEGHPTAAWVHAVLHKIEGDLANSRHWYRLAGRPADVDAEPQEELQAIRETIGGESASD
jgi:hypothetical protein